MSELCSSKLGTKEHWDSVYNTEVENFVDHGEEGEIWFGEDSVDKMVTWVQDNFDDKTIQVIDLGCGNGHLLFRLEDLGFVNLTGVDYSKESINLSQKIGSSHTPPSKASFACLDILNLDDISGALHASTMDHRIRYTLALDKGTLDAISLCEKTGEKSPADTYVETVAAMIKPGGVLLLTSCNWTEAEILDRFKAGTIHVKDGSSHSLFEFMDRIKYPVFKFGGAVGQTITSVALRRL
ncbi:Protein-lysine N-methyltransferase efm4 [Batrachochytrium dendrobatidis]